MGKAEGYSKLSEAEKEELKKAQEYYRKTGNNSSVIVFWKNHDKKRVTKTAIEDIYFTKKQKKELGAWVEAKNIRIDEKGVIADVTMCNGKRTDEYKNQKFTFKELRMVLGRTKKHGKIYKELLTEKK